ncbi:MAG: DNA repair protein RadC [Candidatus Microgenomates bacterium]
MIGFINLPKEEKPRERLLKFGPEALSNSELLAIIFGRGVKGESVLDISYKLVGYFKSLSDLSEASVKELKRFKGLGMAKICQLKACFEIGRRVNFSFKSKRRKIKRSFVSPQDIFEQVREKITNYHKEHFLVVCLDNRNEVIAVEIVSVGTLNKSLIHPRETFEVAIKNHSAQIIICHNHPSGELIPSEDDLIVTKRLVEAGKLLGIEVIDHLIISKTSFFSFAKEKII